MIIEVTKENLDILDSSFISKHYIESELNSNPFSRVLIYIQDKEVVGYIYYSDIYERAEINQIEVSKIHRNCGKATELLQKMLEIVKKDVTLEVKKDNIPAINLYKKFDFKEKTLRKGYYNGVDGILMERKGI